MHNILTRFKVLKADFWYFGPLQVITGIVIFTGDISELKEQYKRYNEDFMKTQGLNKARMEQGLQAKLAARRHKKM